MRIQEILKDGEFDKLTQFTQKEIGELESKIQTRKDGKAGIECIIRGKNDSGDYFELTQEECVRQLYTEKLINEYGYPKNRIEFEKPVKSTGRDKESTDFADIVIWADDEKQQIYIICEIKRPNEKNLQEQKKQLESYCLVEGASLGVLVNGDDIEQFYVKDTDKNTKTRALKEIGRLPKFGESLDDLLKNNRQTMKSLILKDRLKDETLKKIITDLEQRFSANDSSDKSFDEILKLVYCKLFDEYNHNDDADYISRTIKREQKARPNADYYDLVGEISDDDFSDLEFRAKDDEDENQVANRLSTLFDSAQNHWKGAFPPETKLDMQPSTIKSCVREFQNVKLFNSNLEVVDEAFEYLVNKNQKGEMGQYFTPRYVIDMCVKMLNPKRDESMIDTASGSCGFPMHTILHVWQKFDNLTTAKRPPEDTKYVNDNVFAIDFSEKAVRVGRILNIITGDGNTNVLYLNTLDYARWESQFIKNPEWSKKYGDGFDRLKKFQTNKNSYKNFNFDILMANPPFAGDLDDKFIANYDLAKDKKGKIQNKVGRDILFIERNLNFLKEGGRMAIVLPQGRFNNSSDCYIRDYIAKQCRLLAVVGLDGNVFKPHTGTKTSVLFVQKWTDENTEGGNICPKIYSKAKDEAVNIIKNEDGSDKEVLDYPIFFATMQEPSKDNSGDKIYVKEDYLTWTSYTWENVKKITRKSDKKEITQAEYDEAKKKSDYREEIIKTPTVTEHQNQNPTNNFLRPTVFIKDLFEKDNGTIESHKKWQQRKINFVLKPTKDKEKTKGKKETLTLKEYLALSKKEKDFYGETLIEGKNDNPIITNAVYGNLSKEEQKFYDKAESVTEWSERIKDTHGHYFVKHDLFNHDPELNKRAAAFDARLKDRYTKDGIAEAFCEFANVEKLSFFR